MRASSELVGFSKEPLFHLHHNTNAQESSLEKTDQGLNHLNLETLSLSFLIC